MIQFRSYRSKLQTAFLALGLASIGITGWEASAGAVAALRQATYDRLTAIREMRKRQIERYFQDAANHVLALSSDESTIAAIEQFQQAWSALPELEPGGERYKKLREYYEAQAAAGAENGQLRNWFPADPRARALQFFYLAANPHPAGSKDLLLEAPDAGLYGRIHARYHPTLHRYQSAFGFYDIFLIGAGEGRILYTVFKEVDLGVRLATNPYRNTGLARAFERAVKMREPENAVIEDYTPYGPSHFAPAAFLAAPVRRAGANIGVLAIQVSVEEVNRVMTGDRNWRREGLGESGESYIVGPDGTLRSDARFEIERPEQYYDQLAAAGIPREVVERVRRDRTGILHLRVSSNTAREPSTGAAEDYRGVRVIRSQTPIAVPGLDWTLVAQIEADEALKPARTLRNRILGIGLLVAAVFFLAARWLAGSVTRPVRALAHSARRLGGRDFRIRMPVETSDEIGQLAGAFNRMAEDLERTTVSKEELDRTLVQLRQKQGELEVLAGRLITAQEQERSRLARELHDDLTQRLAVVAIEAGRLEQASGDGQPRWREGLERIKREMARISDDVHNLSRRLHPSVLDDLGLAAAIESECRGLFDRGGPPVDFYPEGPLDSLPREAQLGLYRIAQEALRNIQRHAAAEQVILRLRLDGSGVLMEISDDGHGFDSTAPAGRPGLGLASMEERARLLGGTFHVHSRPGEGTRVVVNFPVGGPDEQTESPAGGRS